MYPPIALDLSRLALAPVRRAPRGIDRVELAYARHYLHQWPGPCLPVLPMPWGVRCYSREKGIAFLEAVESLWRENVSYDDDAVYNRTKLFLAGAPRPPQQALKGVKPDILEQSRGYLRFLAMTGFSWGKPIRRELPYCAVYLNVGQLEVFSPLLTWLERRPDVRSVFMIHDLIPLELPEHHLPIGIKLHHRIVRNTARFAQALIAPSAAVGEAIQAALSPFGRGNIPVHVEHLAVADAFLAPTQKDAVLTGLRYFVICGTIDSYKNHLMLLRVWREIVARHGARAPKLVIAGGPGVTSAEVLSFLRNAPDLAGHVMLASGLSTPALRQLMAGAEALLMPSLAEGFGLPVVEALAQGTPVLASDIPAHREAGAGGDVTYLPPADEGQWIAAILAPKCSHRLNQKQKEYYQKDWAVYFNGIDRFLMEGK